MHPIHDVDALLLLSLALASKRRPAELVEIIAAADLIQGAVPAEIRLVEAFSRLASCGLVRAEGGGFTLTADAQKIIVGERRSADWEQRLLGIKERLSAYEATGEHAPVVLGAKEVCAAILVHRQASKSTVKNLLVPKPKAADADGPRPGQRQRKPPPARRRKGA